MSDVIRQLKLIGLHVMALAILVCRPVCVWLWCGCWNLTGNPKDISASRCSYLTTGKLQSTLERSREEVEDETLAKVLLAILVVSQAFVSMLTANLSCHHILMYISDLFMLV